MIACMTDYSHTCRVFHIGGYSLEHLYVQCDLQVRQFYIQLNILVHISILIRAVLHVNDCGIIVHFCTLFLLPTNCCSIILGCVQVCLQNGYILRGNREY